MFTIFLVMYVFFGIGTMAGASTVRMTENVVINFLLCLLIGALWPVWVASWNAQKHLRG